MLFHRNSDVWGQDADEFKPERWFDINEKLESPVGVYSNLYGVCFDVHNPGVGLNPLI